MLYQHNGRPSSKGEFVRVALNWGDKEDLFVCPIVDALRLFFELGDKVRVAGRAAPPDPGVRRLLDEAERG
ncbi:MAG: hypothetical protein HYU88_01440 [Chloroflexi bacterium]|nr:hypothetical protein [Chloroflexota bacterium]MBI4503953.1 hypothetical protein [Chloroflexota bacterium]